MYFRVAGAFAYARLLAQCVALGGFAYAKTLADRRPLSRPVVGVLREYLTHTTTGVHRRTLLRPRACRLPTELTVCLTTRICSFEAVKAWLSLLLSPYIVEAYKLVRKQHGLPDSVDAPNPAPIPMESRLPHTVDSQAPRNGSVAELEQGEPSTYQPRRHT